ncbi:MAG: HAD family hydrolase [Proteobacteria bacterium]|nr:HAD family hydrolase [Pseudomonadota bacterium]
MRYMGRMSARLAVVSFLALAPAIAMAQYLASWNDGTAKKSIVDFVTAVTTEGGPDYVAPADRIATFDNDGTLWSTHAGMTSEEFAKIVSGWIATAKHPATGKLYTQMVYQPMLELLDYLRANDFKVYIVSGGGIEFMRPWTASVYGIPPENVVGSSVKTKYELDNGNPVIVRLPAIDFIDDKEGKPLGINSHIGKRPIAAFGNSDGDFQMLQWTTAGEGRRFGLIVHHDDAKREVAYDRNSQVGMLDRGLDEGPKFGWTIVSMKSDWKQIFPE